MGTGKCTPSCIDIHRLSSSTASVQGAMGGNALTYVPFGSYLVHGLKCTLRLSVVLFTNSINVTNYSTMLETKEDQRTSERSK